MYVLSLPVECIVNLQPFDGLWIKIEKAFFWKHLISVLRSWNLLSRRWLVLMFSCPVCFLLIVVIFMESHYQLPSIAQAFISSALHVTDQTSHVYCIWFKKKIQKTADWICNELSNLIEDVGLAGLLQPWLHDRMTAGVCKHIMLCSAYELCFQNNERKNPMKLVVHVKLPEAQTDPQLQVWACRQSWERTVSAEVTMDHMLQSRS